MVPGQTAAGDDAVHMYVVIKLLIPGVENLDDTGSGPKIFFISGQFQKGLGTAFMEKAVKQFLIAVNQRLQFMGHGKNDMEVWSINHFRPPFIHPDFLLNGLAAGTVAVTAGIIFKRCMTTIRASTSVDTQTPGLAVCDGPCSFTLAIGQVTPGLAVAVIRGVKNQLNGMIRMIMHGDSPNPAGRKD